MNDKPFNVEPEFDVDGYPTETTLDRIAAWPIEDLSDCERLATFVGMAWNWPDRWQRADRRFREWKGAKLRRQYLVSTGGWSGNESLISALERNSTWWMLCWWSSRRGGHFEFRVPA